MEYVILVKYRDGESYWTIYYDKDGASKAHSRFKEDPTVSYARLYVIKEVE